MKRLIVIVALVLAVAMAVPADAKRHGNPAEATAKVHKQHKRHWKPQHVHAKLLSPPFWDCVVAPDDLTTCLPIFPPSP